METTTTTAYDLIGILFAGGMLGIIGQGIRIIVGLKKLDEQRTANPDKQEVFTLNRLLTSIFIGFISGALAILAKWGATITLNYDLILGIMAAGYAGADFIEGLFNTYFKRITAAGQTKETAARSTN